jgi:hypothetical protein
MLMLHGCKYIEVCGKKIYRSVQCGGNRTGDDGYFIAVLLDFCQLSFCDLFRIIQKGSRPVSLFEFLSSVQHHPDPCSESLSGENPEMSPVLVHDPFGNGQSKSGSVVRPDFI